jgi:hypothetical protein
MRRLSSSLGVRAAMLLAAATVAASLVAYSAAAGTRSAVPVRGCAESDALVPQGQAPPSPPGSYVLRRVFFSGWATPTWYQGSKLPGVWISTRTWWMKIGLQVETGGPIVLRVPAAYRRTFVLGWIGNHDSIERMTPCKPDASGRWTFFAGGLYYHRPVCAPVQVGVDGRWQTIRFGLGVNCPR